VPLPDYLPSIDKKYFIDGWFLFCPESAVIELFLRFGGAAFIVFWRVFWR
jgi:hypothetical protein